MKLPTTLLLALCLVGIGACDDDPPTTEDPITEAIAHGCEHFTAGPSEAVTATADVASSPSGWKEHHRIDVTLVDDGAGAFHGHVHLEVDEAGDVVLMLDKNVPVAVSDAGGSAVTVEATRPNDAACTAAATNHVFELGIGTYDVYFSGAPEASVNYVLAHVAADGAH